MHSSILCDCILTVKDNGDEESWNKSKRQKKPIKQKTTEKQGIIHLVCSVYYQSSLRFGLIICTAYYIAAINQYVWIGCHLHLQ